MDFYKQNMECIEKYKPELYKQLIRYNNILPEVQPREIDTVESIDTKDYAKALIIKRENTEYRMNSIVHPVIEAKRWAKQYSFFYLDNVITMYGLGNGLFAEYIVEKMGENYLLVYEPSPKVFIYVIQNYDLSCLFKNSRVFITIREINEESFHINLVNHTDVKNINNRIICVHPSYEKVFPEYAIEYYKELKKTYMTQTIQINTTMKMGLRYIMNTLENLKYLNNCIGIGELGEQLPKDIPIIIVAAGPSVEENIEELRKSKTKAIIIAVDRIVDYLLDNGVKPDIIATVDALKTLEYFSKRENLTIPLMCIFESSVDILNWHKGRKIICHVEEFVERLYVDNKKVPMKICMGGSVATMAFAASIEMGFKNIILVGQDLSYKGKFSYAGQVEEEIRDDPETNMEDNQWVEGIDGNMVLSRFDWVIFLTWYKDMIERNSGIKVYDTKGSGAKIAGTIVKPLSEIMLDYKERQVDIERLIDGIEPTFKKNELVNIREYLDTSGKELKQIKKKAEEASENCEGLVKEWEKNKCTSPISKRYLKEIKRATSFIEKCSIYNLLNFYIDAVSTNELSEIYTFSENEEDSRINTYNISKSIFETTKEACDFVIPLLDKEKDWLL